MRHRPLLPILLSGLLAGCSLFRGEEPDGVLDATDWFEVTPSNGVWDEEYGRTSNPQSCSFRFRVLRETEGLVVEAIVRDDVVVTDDSPFSAEAVRTAACQPWNDDTFQCYFDGDLDGSPDARSQKGTVWGGEYVLTANGVGMSDHSSCPGGFGQKWGGRVYVTREEANACVLDYRLWFSWACLGLPRPPAPEADVTFGFNACVHDDDDGGRADRALYWKGTPAMPYSDESKFQRITLKGRAKK